MTVQDIGIFLPIENSTQKVKYNDVSVQTPNSFSRAGVIEVTVTTAAHMRIANNPTADDVNDIYLVAKVPRQFPVKQGNKAAFIKAGEDQGTAYVTEMQT